ncbi:MAG: hypothetical protein FJY10_02480 [Bacteroidetes bacterium]|nr:hypothetical protein [Bacteroidota bacterium]
MVFESYLMIADTNTFDFTYVCDETCFFTGFVPESLIIQINDASLTLNTIAWGDISQISANELQRQYKFSMDSMKVDKISQYIQKERLIWRADHTNQSRLFYSNKKKLWGDKYLLNGLEYYKNGIYSSRNPTKVGQPVHYGYVDNFDWRNRHGANDPSSPYFDGDLECHTGWMTKPVCQSGCLVGDDFLCNIDPTECTLMGGINKIAGTCWIFGPTAQIEALTNLYYNEHINIDLSEQRTVCYYGRATPYISDSTFILFRDMGIPNEECLPYFGDTSTQHCSTLCPNPQEKISIQSYHRYSNPTQEELQQYLIQYGPVNTNSHKFYPPNYSGHSMVLAGWDVIDEDDRSIGNAVIPTEYLGVTYFIYKQSLGKDDPTTDKGFQYMIHFNDEQPKKIQVVDPLIFSLNRTSADINCFDKDGDSYYFWGIGEKPAHCPPYPAEPDGDDSNPGLGQKNSKGFCRVINSYNASFEKTWDNWAQVGYDDRDWWRHTGPSILRGLGFNTGPLSAQNGDFYIYVHSSCDECYPNKQYTLESPPIDLSRFCESQIEFYYHQYTDDWGWTDFLAKLEVQTSINGGMTWDSVWSIEGNQGDIWHRQVIRFPSTVNKLRFIAKTDSINGRSEIALDNITIGPVLPAESPLVISQSTTWNTNRTEYGNVEVADDAVLTILNCVVSMFSNTKIIIKPGGKLILDNATVTNYCPSEWWHGIEVWGNKAEHQFTINGQCAQGILEMKNGSVIENAYNAVTLWHPDDWNSMGGILIASNSTFLNSRRAVGFMSYHNFFPDTLHTRSNLSSMTNCQFIVDNEYIGGESQPLYAHITMWDVEGVRIKGCGFTNNIPYTDNLNRGYGIYSIDANYSVLSHCNSTTSPCPQGSWINSSFHGLNTAIAALDAASVQAIHVSDASFTDNSIGIKISALWYARLIHNTFDIGPNSTCPNLTGVGIELNQCNGYAVEENTFTKSTNYPVDVYAIGIRTVGSKDGWVYHNEIYKNYFNGTSVGNQSEWRNRQHDPPSDGLCYICNENSETGAYDFFVTGKGIARFQGSSSSPAGNVFSHETANQFGDFYNQSEPIDYVYNSQNSGSPGVPGEKPLEYYNLSLVPTSNENFCISHYPGGGSQTLKLNTGQIMACEQQYMDNTMALTNAANIYEILEDGGNSAAASAIISSSTPSEAMILRDELLGMSPHLSSEILKETADRYEVLPDAIIFEILSANPDELRNEELIEHLEQRVPPFPPYMIDLLRIIAFDTTAKTTLLRQMAGYSSGKTQAAAAILRDMLLDTLPDRELLRNWLDNLGNVAADNMIIDSWLQEGNANSALTLLELVPMLYPMTEDEMEEYGYYSQLKSLQATWITENKNLFQLSQDDLATLEEITEYSEGLARLQAINILDFAYYYTHHDCPSVPDSGFKSEPISIPALLNKVFEPKVTVLNNPAVEWTAFYYRLPTPPENAYLRITDLNGNMITSFPVNNQDGEALWDTRTVSPGMYFYSLHNGKYSANGKVAVVH